MNQPISPRTVFNRLSPLLLAIVSFLLVRIVNRDDYLSHSLLFIAVELFMAVGAAYLLCTLMSRWAGYVMKHGISVVVAYLCPVMWVSATVLVMIFISHAIAYVADGVPFSMGELEVPIVIVALITVWLYAHYESSLIEHKYRELQTRNERISAEMYYHRDRLAPVTSNNHDDSAKTGEIIALKADKVIHRVDVKDIIFVEGMENYLKVYTGEGVIITRSSMKSMLERLPAQHFLQVHRSYIVNLTHIIRLEGNTLRLRHDYCAPVSRPMKAKLRTIILKVTTPQL